MTDALIDKARELVAYCLSTNVTCDPYMEKAVDALTYTLRDVLTRLEAAEKYIELSPCDPDIYQDQHDAWLTWRAIRDAKESK